MRNILNPLIATLEQGHPAVLGGIINSSGSAPRSAGARILVLQDGTLHGTIGGGLVEGTCHEEAKKLFNSPESFSEFHFDLSSSVAAQEGMVCGGKVTVLLNSIEPELLPLFQNLKTAFLQGDRPHLLTQLPLSSSSPELYTYSENNESHLPPEVIEQIRRKKRRSPFLVSHNEYEFLVEPIVHPGTIHIAGAGHVAFATAHLASYADFKVVVIDDRHEFANKERYPTADKVKVIENFNNCFQDLGQEDFVVIVTRGHLHDRDVLAQALKTRAGYIGMIGSSKKRKAVFKSLKQDGFMQEDLDRVFSPIGISIGADTPTEIGFSIVAELIKVRAGLQK
jgi:xanthine dehydrogenase accessory factor